MSDANTIPTNPGGPQRSHDAPFDPASQSLADALRTSFRILKFAILVLVVLYFASGGFVVEQNEEAVVLRLGKPDGAGVRKAGFHWAFPAPIDEIVKVPVNQSSSLDINSHWFFVRASERGRPLSQIMRTRGGLDPNHDGALLTGDRGLVHVRWHVTYRIDDLTKYIALISDSDFAKAESVIVHLLENAAVHVAAGLTTNEVTRTKLADLRADVKRLLNGELERLETGIKVETVEIPESTPPLQTRFAFESVIRAENQKLTTIRQAEQTAAELLNQTAGSSHTKLIEAIDEYDQAVASGDTKRRAEALEHVDTIVEVEASGVAGRLVREAKGYYTSVVQSMRSDAEQYETLLVEYRRQPELLKTRLWEDTKSKLFAEPGVVKIYRPSGTRFWLEAGPDPRQKERRERWEYEKQANLPQSGEHKHLEPKNPDGPLTVK
jgi:modulator of FtsH protease HflK